MIIYHKSIFEKIKNIFKNRTINKIYLIIPIMTMIFIGLEPEVENVPNYKKSIWSTLTSSTKMTSLIKIMYLQLVKEHLSTKQH